jgi:Transposase, Mutator family
MQTGIVSTYNLRMAGFINIEVFMSDRDKGLINGVEANYTGTLHSKCICHLVENFKKEFGKEAAFNLHNMATCYTRTEYYQFREELESKYKNGTDMLLWIDEREPKSRC